MRFLASGIPHLDAVFGGGIPAGDVLLIVGPPGSGKTTLVFQHAFHAASEDRSVVYVSTLSEPAPRLIGHLRTFSYARRLSIGSAELDAMMGGGLPAGGVTIVAGAPGTGKSLLALQYLMAGVSRGEKGLLVGFRETPELLVRKARAFGMDLEAALRDGMVQIRRYAPSELIVDAVLTDMWETIERSDAALLVVDSIAEVEAAIPHDSRRRSVMAAMTELIRGHGVTAVLTREMSQIIGPELDFADSPIEVLAENVVLMRHVEWAGSLARIVSILKMRDSAHDNAIRQYEIGPDHGLHVLPGAQTAEGLLTGIAHLRSEQRGAEAAGPERGRP